MGKPARGVVVTLVAAAIAVAVAAYVRAGRRDGDRPLVAAQVGESPDSAAIAQDVYLSLGRDISPAAPAGSRLSRLGARVLAHPKS